MERAASLGVRVIEGERRIARGPYAPPAVPPADLDAWATILSRELSRLSPEERRDIDAVLGALEPAFVEHRWSGAYWKVDGPVAVLRQVVAPEQSGVEFAVPLVGTEFIRGKLPVVFGVAETCRARFVPGLVGATRGLPLFSSGAFVPVHEGERAAGVLAIHGPGLGADDLAVPHLVAQHLAMITALSGTRDAPSTPRETGRIAALIASEIKNPVRGIASLSGRLRERLSRDSSLGGLTADLDREATRLRLLLEDLLDYTRPLTPWPDSVPLDIVLRSVLVSAQRVYRESFQGRTVVLEIERPAPIARVDPALLSRALSNVLVNVAERTKETTTMVVSVKRHQGEARIRLAFEGDPWLRGSEGRVSGELAARRRRHAISLGVARRLIRAMGGRLVRERRRVGAAYSLRVPLDPSG